MGMRRKTLHIYQIFTLWKPLPFYLILLKITKAEKVISSYYFEENHTVYVEQKKTVTLSSHEDTNTETAWSTHGVFLHHLLTTL